MPPRTRFVDRDGNVHEPQPTRRTINIDTVVAEEVEEQHDEFPIPPADGYLGGPYDTSLLIGYGSHVAESISRGEDRGELGIYGHGLKLPDLVIEHEEVQTIVNQSGLSDLVHCHKLVDKGLISAFVERWHWETSSFHLPVGEMTITLDDVSSLLHIPVVGAPLTFTVFDKDESASLLHNLLGLELNVIYTEFSYNKSPRVRFTWLADVYASCISNEDDPLRWVRAARVFLFRLIGMTLFTDKSRHTVNVTYLECFHDLNVCSSYAWGAATLAHLYDHLKDATAKGVSTVAGYLSLLQSWIHQYFPIYLKNCMKKNSLYDESLPRVIQFLPKRGEGKVLSFRKMLDEMDIDSVRWSPYDKHRRSRPFEAAGLYRGWIRCGGLMYAHLPDRCMRQFGYIQTIPSSPTDVISHTTTPEEMDVMLMQYNIHVVDTGVPVTDPGDCADDYMEWFHRHSHPYLIPENLPAPSENPPPPPAHVVNSDNEIALRQAAQMLRNMIAHGRIVPDGMNEAREILALIVRVSGGGVPPVQYERRRRR